MCCDLSLVCVRVIRVCVRVIRVCVRGALSRLWRVRATVHRARCMLACTVFAVLRSYFSGGKFTYLLT